MPPPWPRWIPGAIAGAALAVLTACASHRLAAPPAHPPPAPASAPLPPASRPARMRVVVTAYCQGRTTASGARIAPGMAAADPRVFPMGTEIEVIGLPRPYGGVYR